MEGLYNWIVMMIVAGKKKKMSIEFRASNLWATVTYVSLFACSMHEVQNIIQQQTFCINLISAQNKNLAEVKTC